jgi:transcriptional regulator with XRE-family HTH domain
MKKTLDHIGKNVRRLRSIKGWNQTEAAKRLRVSTAAFSNIETGITDISISRLYKLAELFHVSVSEILFDARATLITDCNECKTAINLTEMIRLQNKIIRFYEHRDPKMSLTKTRRL